MDSAARSITRLLRVALPAGGALPPAIERRRHEGVQILLIGHVPVVLGFALLQGNSLGHSVIEASIPAAMALMSWMVRSVTHLAMVVTSLGLMTCSALFVHLSDGLIEMHFHYFVVVGVVTLYQDWRPFLTAIGYVVLQHGIMGALSPEAVYNHPAAIASPWRWAAVHGGFVLAMSATGMVNWKLNEALLTAAAQRQRRLDEAQQQARLGSWDFDPVSGAMVWSNELYRLLGVMQDTEPTVAHLEALADDADRGRWAQLLADCVEHGVPVLTDVRAASDGPTRWMHVRIEPTLGERGSVVAVSGTVQDITDRRRSEDELRRSQDDLASTLSLLNATLDSTADGLLVVDLGGKISGFNSRFVEMWGIPDAILEAREDSRALAFVLDQVVDPVAFLAKVHELYAFPEAESEDVITFRDGRIVERLSSPQLVDGTIVGRVWSFRDVTGRCRLESELEHRAFHDALTALPNQALFRDRMDHAIDRSRRTHAVLGVLFLDLDHFKTVNDSLGHSVGDELLIAVAERVRGSLRASDTAARMGGDEFCILLEDMTHADEAAETADRLLAAFEAPFTLADREVFVSVSIGIATGTGQLSRDQLLRNADLAMYAAKRLGRNRYAWFEAEMHTTAVERIEILSDLRRAIERDEFVVHYQPIVSVTTGEIVSAEALVRWQHPERGLLLPGAFIPYAEESDLIEAIGAWVLSVAVRDACDWHRVDPVGAISVAVNLSSRQLRDPSIIDTVASTLLASGLDASSLTLEITESSMMDDPAEVRARLDAVKALGVRLAIDDFGTGYSSLSYLHDFPIDVLKVDRAFVQRLGPDPEESGLAKAIVRLAETLRLTAVAEGVETSEQLEQLAAIGCPLAQGFLLHRPMPADELAELLAHRRASSRDPSPSLDEAVTVAGSAR